MSIPSSRIRDNLHALSAPENQPKTLPIIEPVGAIAAQRGVAEFEVAQSGGGVSGDLTEVPGSREYYSAITIIPDGAYFAYLVAPVKKLTFTDGEGQTLTASLEFPDYPVGADNG